MKAIIYLDRSITECVEIEVDNFKHLAELAKNSDELHEEIHRQEKEFEETVGEVLNVSYELDGKTYIMNDENNLVESE